MSRKQSQERCRKTGSVAINLLITDELRQLTTDELIDELRELTTDGLIRQFRRRKPRVKPSSGYVSFLHDEIAHELVKHGEDGIRVLLRALDSSDVIRYRSIIRALGWKAKTECSTYMPRIRRILRAALKDPRPFVAEDALRSLTTQLLRVRKQRVLAMFRHGNPSMMSQALSHICRFYPRAARPCIETAMKSRYYLVRASAIDEIDDAGMREFLPEVRRLLADRHRDVRQAAETAVRNLSSPEH